MKLTLHRATLEKLHQHAASAARIVGHLDDAIAVGPLGDHIDAIAHTLAELLGDPGPIAAPVPNARSPNDDDVDVDAPTEVRARRSDVGVARIEAVGMAELTEGGGR